MCGREDEEKHKRLSSRPEQIGHEVLARRSGKPALSKAEGDLLCLLQSSESHDAQCRARYLVHEF